MSRWVRSAEVNKNLIVVLVIVVLGAGGFYLYRWRSAVAEKAVYQSGTTFKLFCPGWAEPREFTKADAEKLKKENNKVENPDTHVFECKWGSPPSEASDVIRP